MATVHDLIDMKAQVGYEGPLPEDFAQGRFHGYPLYTVIADGDWTIYEARSHEDTFLASPAREPVLEWIRLGVKTDLLGKKIFSHHFILTTGGDYQMAHDRFIQQVPNDLRAAVTLVTNAGARLFYYDSVHNCYQESEHYSSCAIEGGVGIDKTTQEDFLEKALVLINLFFSYLKKDEELRKEVQQAPYGERVQAFAAAYPEEGVSLERFRQEKRVLYGIDKTLNVCPRIELRGINEDRVVQISIVGMFSNLPRLREYPEFQQILAQLGSYPHTILSQNLCVLEVSRTNKGTTLKYLGLHPDYSCGLGDSPEGNDKPLGEYWALIDGQNRLMPFVSVAETFPENLPNQYHIGNRVLGTKAFFE
ncbi:MAG: hypothetical protein FJZ63_05685, partial [Chlamydiae bacterium]|nr:hypothetical protein [Chlamydiota bacterium]